MDETNENSGAVLNDMSNWIGVWAQIFWKSMLPPCSV